MEEQERLDGLKSAHIREMQNRNVRVSSRIEDFLEIIVAYFFKKSLLEFLKNYLHGK